MTAQIGPDLEELRERARKAADLHLTAYYDATAPPELAECIADAVLYAIGLLHQ